VRPVTAARRAWKAPPLTRRRRPRPPGLAGSPGGASRRLPRGRGFPTCRR